MIKTLISVIGILVIIPEPVRNRFDYWCLEFGAYNRKKLTLAHITEI